MLRNMVQKEIILYVMAILVIVCVIAKLISAITVRKMVGASREIHKSNHRFMKLIKSKFEHATLVSERVQNVEAFVEKYIYEYKVFGMRLHAWGSIVKTLIWLIGILGVFAIFESYRLLGFKDLTIEYIQWTGIFLLLLLLLQFVEEEGTRIKAAKNYIIEYLENVCAFGVACTYWFCLCGHGTVFCSKSSSWFCNEATCKSFFTYATIIIYRD